MEDDGGANVDKRGIALRSYYSFKNR